VQAELDTSIVDVSKLSENSLMPNHIREKLLNESILHLNSNARKKAVFKLMEAEILVMKALLEKKCSLVK
jgi:hypothetical protein